MSSRSLQSVSVNFHSSKNIARSRKARVLRNASIASAVIAAMGGITSVASADSELVGWNVTSLTSAVSTVNATTVSSQLTSPVTLSFGSGFSAHLMSSPGFQVSSSSNSSSGLTGSSGAEHYNQYFKFTLTPTVGNALNVDNINVASWYAQNTWASTMYVTTSTTGASLGSVALGNGAYSSGNISLGSALQGQTSPVTLYLYVSGNWAYQTAGFCEHGITGDDLQIIGSFTTTTAAVTWTGLSGGRVTVYAALALVDHPNQ